MDNQTKIRSQQHIQETRLQRLEAKGKDLYLSDFYGMWRGLPGLRGLWYPGTLGETGSIPDASDSARTLSYAGNPTMNLYNDLIPYMDYDGTGDYHTRGSEAGLQVVGTEGSIASALRGLTVGGIWWFDSLPAAFRGLIGKYTDAGNQRSYLLYYNNTLNQIRFVLSNNGAASVDAATGLTPSTGQWYFILGRWYPSVKYGTFYNGTWGETTTTPPATLFSNTAAFQIAAYNAGTNNLDGRCALAFLAASAWPDTLVDLLWRRSRKFFDI